MPQRTVTGPSLVALFVVATFLPMTTFSQKSARDSLLSDISSGKTHVVDLFQFTQEPLRDQLLALLERDATPRWGKIDYDQDGKLIGNWFKVGTGGYGAVRMAYTAPSIGSQVSGGSSS